MGFADGDQLREFPSVVESVSAWTQRMEEPQSPSSPPQSTPFSSLFSLVAATSKAGRGTGELRHSLTSTKAPWLAQSSHSFTSQGKREKKPRTVQRAQCCWEDPRRSQEHRVSSLTPPLKLIN